MQRKYWIAGGLSTALLFAGWTPLMAQRPLPLEPQRPSGLAISPMYEGWYRNPAGSFTLSFGYLNRNLEEVLEIPVGAQNSIEGAQPPQGLPTHFLPRRHYGVFTVTVPANFGPEQRVVWTLDIRGRRFSIPGRLNALWEIDALGAPATGDKPPALKLAPAGLEARGPDGIIAGPVDATVGSPLELTAWARSESEDSLALSWYKWSGPGEVSFSAAKVPVDSATGQAKTTATFSEPGDYVVYVRTNESDDGNTGHEQCCWTNGYVRVRVRR